MAVTARKDGRFEFRTTPQQETLIRRAAETSGRTLTDFLLESAMDRAVDVLADKRLFLLDDDAWNRFNAALDGPSEPVSALVDLLRDDDL